jgi:nitroreductase
MTISEAIENRRSIRRYKPDDVPQPVLEKVLNAARLAPSSCNRQARKFIVVRDKDTKSRLANASPYRFPGPKEKLNAEADCKFEKAPVVIVACSLVQDAYMRYFGSEDEDFVIFSNVIREKAEPEYWDEFVEHSRSHTGEYENIGTYDLAMALDHLSLAAVGEGLGTCWIGGI